ncbi:MAG: purine-nucleoside phosphorylase [Lachnospiraceae bacterium]|nr:purine-nucleoside phosphorylase [Lachnospiraceae bacterium]
MTKTYERLLECYQCVREKIDFQPKVALVLGSGLGDYADTIQIEAVLDYHEIKGFPISTVSGHKGRFVFGYVGEVPVVIMQGRVHYYEGYSMEDVVLPTRLMKMMGAEILFLTNAAGGVNFDFRAGDFMMITDQISSFVPSPLIGPNVDELGLRFSDMSEIYRKDLCQIIRDSAADLQIPLREGTYIQLTGPNFETPHEVKMCRILGADAVGMSTACEAVAANHMGMKVCGISCISNLGCGMTDQPLSHEEVKETADRVAPLFKQLITESIKRMGCGHVKN